VTPGEAVSDASSPERELREEDLADEPTDQFVAWFDQAVAAGQPEPEAMCVATATLDGVPSARMVLLKAYDRRGFTFYTNEGSRKGLEMEANPVAALTWRWGLLDRQVRVAGRVERVSEPEADAYFASRARGSQLGAWASFQSTVVPTVDGITARGVLEADVAEIEGRFEGVDVTRPPYWGGFRVVPETVEFWQGRRNRLHDRLRYRRAEGGWVVERLFP
jgi:pyridoxamine 5'-phosphate oxidase